MRIQFQVNPRLSTEVEGNSHKEIFEKLSSISEVFAETSCGSCNNEEIRFQVRTVAGNNFYEMKCEHCGAKLEFGQHKTGGSLFPKRKLDSGEFDREHRGWHIYEGGTKPKVGKKNGGK